MTSNASAYGTGTDLDTSGLRKRPVTILSSPASNGTRKPETDDKKQTRKSISSNIDFASLESILSPILFTILAFFTRMYKIGQSNIVTWDEAHFGKFGAHYLKREFYFDVHPPLGKMLVGLSGYMAGYNGTFDFKSGEAYPEEVNYTFMRMFNATFGALCVPLAYYTAKELGLSKRGTWLVTLMVLCENSYATISRFILLDSMLLFFTFSTMLCMTRFHNLQKKSFSLEWFFWIFLSGISIGCVCSVKWIGIFVTALVGLYTVEDLWNKFGDLSMPMHVYAGHWFARMIGLIFIPLLVYMASFKAHFIVLQNSGPGDAQMSSLFQASLQGTSLTDSPLDVAIGSRVTIKNMGYGGGLLHSHVQLFPEGSGQQQVTCYHHKDANNDWFFYPARNAPDYDPKSNDLRFVGNGDVVRFVHSLTGRNLHSHMIPAPITKSDWEVSGYGNLTIGDEKDHWIIEIIDDTSSKDFSRLRTLTSSFRLRHAILGCYLRAANVNLPQWGFKQVETTCAKKSNPNDKHTHWNVESHWNEKLPKADIRSFRSPFLKDFIHLNVAMMTSNNALVPDPDKQDDLASYWWEWPILHAGLRMCSWDDKTVKYYLLGNPIVYWGSTASLMILGVLVLVYLVRWQRAYNDLSLDDIDHIHYAGIYPAIGWFFHYFPFMAMARVTYVHHYFPALYFAILVFGFVFNHLCSKLPRTISNSLYGLAYAAIVGIFILFFPISVGMTGSAKQYSYLKWSKNWKIS